MVDLLSNHGNKDLVVMEINPSNVNSLNNLLIFCCFRGDMK